ncbi:MULTISPECIES: hypothetical protein [unclassified Coleofasciculus]|nr:MULTISPECIES: hypothetical protein [unclassified Coleofasciculus]MBE9146949.1 hypothetical protein [Coleofasciculus sp. LEGE 07092]
MYTIYHQTEGLGVPNQSESENQYLFYHFQESGVRSQESADEPWTN